MSCGCSQTPCACAPVTTKCDRDTVNNVWLERGVGGENAPGICLLDTLKREQIIDVIERDERARVDLLRVTSDPELLALATKTKRLTTAEEADLQQKWVNKNEAPASSPFYGLFRGQPPFAQ